MQQLSAGATLQGGKYTIERVLGQGGFGITYLATHSILEKHVARITSFTLGNTLTLWPKVYQPRQTFGQ